MILNTVLIAIYGALVFGIANFSNWSESLSGISFNGSVAQLWIEALLVLGAGFGLPNLFLILWRKGSVRGN